MNNDVDLKAICSAIKTACPKAPLTYRSERVVVFRGVVLVILEGKANSDRINFPFCDVESFLVKLREHGLMLKPHEVQKILARYYLETI